MENWCETLPTHTDSLAISAVAHSNTVLWIILSMLFSSGKTKRILPFILMFVLATLTFALPIPLPTINITKLLLLFLSLFSPFAFVLSSPAVWLVSPLHWVISTVYIKLLSACTNHMEFVQLHTPLRLIACPLCLLSVQVTVVQAGAASWRCQEEHGYSFASTSLHSCGH